MGEIPLSLLTSAGGEGAEVVYGLRNNSTLADMILENIGNSGQIKRKTYQRRLPENPSKDYYYIIRETNPRESVLIEYGFIDNTRDLKKLQNDLDLYAEGVVKAIADYTNTKYVAPNQEITPDFPIDSSVYIVQRGDTLYAIANRFGITVEELKKANNLSTNNLFVGQQLIIPSVINDDIPQEETDVYIVQRGDTLYAIANRFGITVEDLKNMNNLFSNSLSVGQQLLVPKNDTNIENDINNDNSNSGSNDEINENESIYIVKKGDSLYSIANNNGISVNDLIAANNLNDLTIYVGQQLIIPEVANENIIYTVVRGDTLYQIANRYGVSVNDIITANNLQSTVLSIGQQLIIPQ